MEAQDIHELAAGYALNALDDDERQAFEEHLEGCERCRTDLAALEEAASSLAYAVEGPAPTPALRDRILVQARAERPNVVPLRPRRTWVTAVAAVAAVAACAAVGLGVWAATLSSDLDQERSARRAADAALTVLSDPNAARAAVQGADGVLAVARDGSAALAVALAPAPSGRTYEAWVLRPGAKPAPAGTFEGRSGGRTVVRLQRPVPPGARVAVTLERAGGAQQPTSSPLLTTGAPA